MIEPLGSRVVVTNDEEKQEVGGLYIPNANSGPTKVGRVDEVGKDVVEVAKHDRIAYNAHAAITITVRGVDYVVVEEKHIIAKL